MATVEDVAALALSAIDVSAEKPIGIEQVGKWVSNRYAELVGRSRFRHQRRFGVITIPASIATGTATVAAGATAVTMDTDAQTAITAAGGSAAIVGRYVRFFTVWYEISAYVAPTLTIAEPFTENDLSSGGGFKILPRFHTLDATARWMGKFVFPRRRRQLSMRSFHDMDRTNPERMLTADGPWYVAEAANSAAGLKRVELYPYSLTEETIYYVFWPIPAALGLDSTIPQEIDPYVLREGVLIDLYRYRASQAANAGKVEEAGYWRNESRAQTTSYETQVGAACRADRGQDDVSFIYNVLGLGTGWNNRDVMTARDQVYVTGNRP